MSMASTSNRIDSSYYASSSTPRWDVFLSFRGEDTRKNFTGHLYWALDRVGIRTFMDDPELPRGEEISSQLLKAIQESKVSIVVFSKNYASSRWCLDELVKILECKRTTGQVVLPVFYNVHPSAVRYKTNSFGEAFKSHKERFGTTNMETVEKWEAALTEAANLSGYHLETETDGHEAKLIQITIKRVLREVNLVCLNVASKPVGIESRVKYIGQLLSIGTNDIRKIGIYGMGGIGKTTIAKALFNENFRSFEGSCFLANVREASEERNGILQLQEQLLFDILKVEIKVKNVDNGISLLKDRLCSKKVLIVLDDLDHLKQLDQLVGQWNQFASGSRIIITTRDAHLLDQIGVEGRHNVEGLGNDEALELFSLHAFKKSVPPEDYIEISKGIVRQAGGLPLALEVLGSYFFKRSMIEWRSSLDKLQEIPKHEIQKKLIISYDALVDINLKDVFLDIASFLIGKDKDKVVDILNSCGFNAENEINNLIHRCLLSIDDQNKLRMHDLLRDMGREIVNKESPKKPGKRSRLWSTKDISYVLEKQKGTEAIEVIIPNGELELEEATLNTKTFEGMDKLRLLNIDNIELTGNFQHIFKELRWLSWQGCPLRCLPSEVHWKKLVFLDLRNSEINILWHGLLFLERLKVLNLDGCRLLKTTPNFTGVPNLERLLLGGCRRLAEIHPSIGHLSKLVFLDLSDCKILRRIPNSICNLRALESLCLKSCKNLEELPEELLPCNISQLSNLNSLDLQYCRSLRSLTKLPPNLEKLDATGCRLMERLPNLLNLKHMRLLLLANCSRLVEIQGLDKLGSIQQIHLEGCTNLAFTFKETFFQAYSTFGKQINIFLPTREIPDWFDHQIEGICMGPKSEYFVNMSTICFDVPKNGENKFLGMILWMVSSKTTGDTGVDAVVKNKTNGDQWFHHHQLRSYEAFSWVSFIAETQIAVKFGDKIEAFVYGSEVIWERFGVHLVYKTDTIENY